MKFETDLRAGLDAFVEINFSDLSTLNIKVLGGVHQAADNQTSQLVGNTAAGKTSFTSTTSQRRSAITTWTS